MPELPEVNTLAVALNKRLVGDAIKKWQRYSTKLRVVIPEDSAVEELRGREIAAIRRVAKSIYFDVGTDRCVHVHLGMTGYFVLSQNPCARLAHEHLRIELISGRLLHYCDPRRFGVIELARFPENAVVEPFAGSLNWQYLTGKCQRSRRTVKTLIMDQSVIAGLGNIYAAEALLDSGILPLREACSLTTSEVKGLCKSIIKVIDFAVRAGLKSLEPEFRIDADTTHFPIVTNVYGKEGEICVKCKKTQILHD